MTQLLTVEEFEQLLTTEEEQARPRPVFVAPTKRDTAYHKRRIATLEFQRQQVALQTEVTQGQARMAQLNERMNGVNQRLAGLAARRAAGDDEAEIETEERQAQAEQAQLTEQLFALMPGLDEALVKQAAFLDQQVAFLLPFIRAIKYPPTTPDGSWSYKARPWGREQQAEFDAEARALLEESSEEEFQQMLDAATAQGQGAVPSRSGGK